MITADVIMQQPVDQSALAIRLNRTLNDQKSKTDYYKEDLELANRCLHFLLKPNVVIDNLATANARQAAYDRVMANPIMINRGTRIVSQGETITEEIYRLLVELDLTKDGGYDLTGLVGMVLLVITLTLMMLSYIRSSKMFENHMARSLLALVIAWFIPLIVSASVARYYPLSPPVYFLAVVVAAYFGFPQALVASFALVAAILPMTGFDPEFALISTGGCLVASLYAGRMTNQDSYARIILMTSLTNGVLALAFGLMQKELWSTWTTSAFTAIISGAVSVIAAIGIMPLFEIIFNTVSPMRLIELSQPGHPLLKRLFVEAPGTSQHSMMVANLADTAAEVIGANAMITRVGAYYHDIGKLEQPLMFTENQSGVNPHDQMTPEESAAVITGHPEVGCRIGKESLRCPFERLFASITARRSCNISITKRAGSRNPRFTDAGSQFVSVQNVDPSNRESAIVMLAD